VVEVLERVSSHVLRQRLLLLCFAQN